MQELIKNKKKKTKSLLNIVTIKPTEKQVIGWTAPFLFNEFENEYHPKERYNVLTTWLLTF